MSPHFYSPFWGASLSTSSCHLPPLEAPLLAPMAKFAPCRAPLGLAVGARQPSFPHLSPTKHTKLSHEMKWNFESSHERNPHMMYTSRTLCSTNVVYEALLLQQTYVALPSLPFKMVPSKPNCPSMDKIPWAYGTLPYIMIMSKVIQQVCRILLSLSLSLSSSPTSTLDSSCSSSASASGSCNLQIGQVLLPCSHSRMQLA